MRIVEYYYCRAHRDQRYRELLSQGIRTRRSTSRNSVLSPNALSDFSCYPYKPSPNGFGGYSASYMPAIYKIEG